MKHLRNTEGMTVEQMADGIYEMWEESRPFFDIVDFPHIPARSTIIQFMDEADVRVMYEFWWDKLSNLYLSSNAGSSK